MKDNELHESSGAEPGASEADPAEVKRLAARRRMLKGGVATGAILTILHQRASATNVIYVSSAATCTSLHGTAGQQVQVIDSITKKKVTRTQCTR